MQEDLDVLRNALPCDRSFELEGITVDHDYLPIRFCFWWRGHCRSVQFLLLLHLFHILFSSRLRFNRLCFGRLCFDRLRIDRL